MSILPFLLCAITCTPNADGTWTCSGDVISDLPNVIEQNGNYVCTNCLDISSNECERIKIELHSYCERLNQNLRSIEDYKSEFLTELEQFTSVFDNFEPCPYTATTSLTDVKNQYGLDTSLSYTKVVTHQRRVIIPQWEATANWSIVQLEPDFANSTLQAFPLKFHNELCGLWSCSYQFRNYLLDELQNLATPIRATTEYIESSKARVYEINLLADSVTCAPCKLGASSSGGGGGGGSSGSETGCLECYLAQLRQINSNLDTIKSYLSQIKDDLSQFKTDFNREIQNILDQFEDLNDTANRIDDYLSIDQSNRLYRIHLNIESISNIVSRLHKSFALASDSNIDNDIRDVFTSQGFDWIAYNEKTNWFNRVEILLAHIAGVDSNLVSSVEDDATLSNNVGIVDYDTAFNSYENDTSQESAEQDAQDVIDSFSDVVQAFNFFGSVHEPTDIWFIESGAIDIGSYNGSMAVNVKMSDESYFRDFLRCIRWGCVILWYLLGAGLLYFLFITLYEKIMKLIRFCLSLSASVFGS